MDPKQAWQVVCTQLQMDLSKDVFEKRVRVTQFVSYENENFVISVPATYTRDWLESRLTSTANRLLTGIMNCNVTIQFICQETIETNEQLPDNDAVDEDDIFDIEADFESDYDAIARPDRIVAIPKYFLRHLPYLKPETAWLYVGFRQATYLAGYKKSDHARVSVGAHQIVRFSGASRATFFRYIKSRATWERLTGLVRRINHDPEKQFWQRADDGKPHRLPNSYRVAVSLPLTGSDAFALRNWLQERTSENKDALEILRQATQTPVRELLATPDCAGGNLASTRPQRVRDVVSDLFINSDTVPELVNQLMNLADQLRDHIMLPHRVALISHYFLEHWVARLGAGPAWLVVMMRQRAYQNDETGEIRDRVFIPGGYSEMASWLGLQRSKTIWEWMQKPDVRQFIYPDDQESGHQKDQIFRIALREPLLNSNEHGAFETHRRGAFETTLGANETIRGAFETHKHGAFETQPWRDCDGLSSLSTSLNHLTSSSTTPKTVVGGQWDFTTLVSHARINPRIGQSLQKRGVSARSLISWLLYAGSESGLTIRDPVAHAIRRLKENPTRGAGGVYDRLASIPPNLLVQFICHELSRRLVTDLDWHTAMGQTKPCRLRVLADQLGITYDTIPAQMS